MPPSLNSHWYEDSDQSSFSKHAISLAVSQAAKPHKPISHLHRRNDSVEHLCDVFELFGWAEEVLERSKEGRPSSKQTLSFEPITVDLARRIVEEDFWYTNDPSYKSSVIQYLSLLIHLVQDPNASDQRIEMEASHLRTLSHLTRALHSRLEGCILHRSPRLPTRKARAKALLKRLEVIRQAGGNLNDLRLRGSDLKIGTARDARASQIFALLSGSEIQPELRDYFFEEGK